jgi:hypothetical protein
VEDPVPTRTYHYVQLVAGSLVGIPVIGSVLAESVAVVVGSLTRPDCVTRLAFLCSLDLTWWMRNRVLGWLI